MKRLFPNLLKRCGKLCAEYRRETLGKTQKDVAQDLGYSVENIASFEQGRNDNLLILLWYIKHGLLENHDIEEILGHEEIHD